jgi:16S rRNA processing protein RimM
MARLVGAFGIKGWVKVKAFTATPQALGAHCRWLVGAGGDWREMAVEDFAVHSRGPVAKLAGCEDREGADRLRGLEVAVPRESLGDAGEGWMYRIDLVGLDVVDRTGASLGQVESFFDAGEASVMVVAGTKRHMIPFVPAYVTSVDRDRRRVTVDWEGE